MFVVGGSYKSFYINYLNGIRDIDLLVFHQNIFYEYNYETEKDGCGVVGCELLELNNKFKCPIVVYGKINKNNIIKKCFILCINNKINIIDNARDIYLYINKMPILIGAKIYFNSKAFATISFTDEVYKWKKYGKSDRSNHLICDKRGVTSIKNGKICRKFRKCCYFALKKK